MNEIDRRQAMRKAIATAMSRSHREIPHYYLETALSAEAALAWLQDYNQTREPAHRLLPIALWIKATALALRAHPELNGYYLEDEPRPQPDVHLGVVISLRGGGIMAPCLHHADKKDLRTIMAELQNLVIRTRSGRVRSSELSDATATLTSLGDEGVEKVFGLIYPPQVALIGFGRVYETCRCSCAATSGRSVAVTLAADHRASDGLSGSKFLRTLRRLLETPAPWTAS